MTIRFKENNMIKRKACLRSPRGTWRTQRMESGRHRLLEVDDTRYRSNGAPKADDYWDLPGHKQNIHKLILI